MRKIAILDFVYNPASANIDQSTPDLVTILYDQQILDKFNYGYNGTGRSYLPLN